VKALVDRVAGLLHGRAELFTTELEEELTRLIGVMLWALVAVFTTIIGTTFLAVMALLFLPPSFRGWAAAIIAVLFLAVAAFGLVSIRKIVRAKPRPFDASLTELAKDRARLRGER
jgi:uncharacterized membrane protein YqjE